MIMMVTVILMSLMVTLIIFRSCMLVGIRLMVI